MEVTEFGMDTEANEVQMENASLPIEETESGMKTEEREEPQNAPSAMQVIPLGIL